MDEKFSDLIQVSAKGSLILILGQIGSTMISAIGTIIIARTLGPTSFGIISIAQIPVSVLLMLINNGVSNAIINFLAENRHKKKEETLRSIVYAGFLINIGIGFLTTLTLYLVAGFLANQVFQKAELEQLIKILSVSLFAQALMNTAFAVFVGFEKMGQRSLISIFYSLLKSVVGPILVFLGYGVIGAAVGYSLPFLIGGIVAVFLSLLSISYLPPTPRSSIAGNMFSIIKYAYPLFFSNLFSGSLNQVFHFILPFYVSATAIGNFSAATSFSVLVQFFTVPLSIATFPLLSKLKPDDGVFEYVFQSIIKYESIIVFPVASAIIALSDQIVAALYSESYALTPLFLRVFMLNFFFIGLADTLSTSLLNSQKETKVTFRRTLIYLIVGIPMGFILIPRFGIIGFQITTLLAPKIGLAYSLWWIKHNYEVSVDYNNVFKILLSSLIGIFLCEVTVRLLYANIWIEMIVGGSVLIISYMFSILVTGALLKKNIEDIYSIVKKYERLKPVIDLVTAAAMRLARN